MHEFILELHKFEELSWLKPFFRVILIGVCVFFATKVIHLLTQKIIKTAAFQKSIESNYEREKRLATVMGLLDTTVRVVLYGVATLMILREIGIDISPILTGAGIAGVAVGFGAQSLVKDLIAGFFFLIEDQIRVGDVVKINGGISGKVERIELRVIAIRGGDGALHVVPNGEVKIVSNMTYDFSQAVVSVPISYHADMKQVFSEFKKIADEFDRDMQWKGFLRGKPEFLGITAFDPNFMSVEINVKTDPHKRWVVERELRVRVKAALDAIDGSKQIPAAAASVAPSKIE